MTIVEIRQSKLGVRLFLVFFFFFKQKTAYEILTCDWSSDVCSSDLTCIWCKLKHSLMLSSLVFDLYRFSNVLVKNFNVYMYMGLFNLGRVA